MRLQDSLVELLPDGDKEGAILYRHSSYDVVNTALDQIVLRVANYLQHAGYGAFPVPASKRTDDENICGIFSQKLAAHLAGLGWIGKSCLLITPTPACGCGGMMSVEDEIKALEVHRQHMKLQLEMIEKRISGLKHVGK